MSLPRVQSRSGTNADVDATAPKVHVVTFGCQMNKYDSLLVEGRFQRHGYRIVGEADEADVLLFNTCSVRDHAEERVFSWIGELKRRKETRPELVIGVLGCMAQRVGEEIFRRAGHVDLVVGTRAFHNLPDMVAELRQRRANGLAPKKARVIALSLGEQPDDDREGEPYTGGRLGYLAVMRGCDLNCTFCVVPKTRGRVLSRPLDELEAEARWMVAQGAQVITLLGQTINSYGEDLAAPGPNEPKHLGRQGRPSLADVLYRLQQLDGLVRIRMITGHAAYVTPALARAIAECPKVDRFFPLPVQSGSDRILRAMKRGYTTELYRDRLSLLRDAVPDIELGTDWIVGFPGETDEDFEASERWLAEQAYVQNYVFKYSPRPDTHAGEALVDDVPEATKTERNQRLLRTAERTQLLRLQGWIGKRVQAFVEGKNERGLLVARSFHNLPISFAGEDASIGTVLELEPTDATSFGLFAKRV
ncbi:MAG: tRNA (N6-isopentenyl adenosine(37)-C2)-methylthiotransferase MiaB [Planctomycetes bacterium]|nr:tRNA (N6-isopentenyl adenosine(37)-C2)-methylthiotransferase MiaB [Planctomycetota bacterium]